MKRVILTLACLAAFLPEAFALTVTCYSGSVGELSGALAKALDDETHYDDVTTLIVTGKFGDEDLDFCCWNLDLDTLDLSGADFTETPHNPKSGNDYYIWDNALSAEYSPYIGSTLNVKTWILPNTLENIPDGVFLENPNPYYYGDEDFIYDGVFSKIERFEFKDNPYFTSVDGVIFDKKAEKLIAMPPNYENVTYTLPPTTQEIASMSCVGSKISALYYYSGLNTIRESAFAYCKNLREIKNVGESAASKLGTIERFAFARCINLTDVVLPDNVSVLSSEAFVASDNIETIVYPEHLIDLLVLLPKVSKVEIPRYTEDFLLTKDADPMIEITVDPENEHFVVEDGGVIYNKDKSAIYYFPQAKTGKYELPESVRIIKTCAFRASSIESVSMPSVEEIEGHAFQYSSISGNIEAPKATVVGDYSDGAFTYCKNIKGAKFDSLQDFCGINFSGSSIEELDLPSVANVSSMGSCRQLKKLYIGHNDLSIDDGDEFLSIPEVYVRSQNPPAVDWSWSVPDEIGTLYVPTGSRAKYLMANFWREYMDVQEIEMELGGAQDAVADDAVRVVATSGGIRLEGADEATRVAVYDVSGRMMYDGTDTEIALPQGMYIVKAGNEVSKVVVR